MADMLKKIKENQNVDKDFANSLFSSEEEATTGEAREHQENTPQTKKGATAGAFQTEEKKASNKQSAPIRKLKPSSAKKPVKQLTASYLRQELLEELDHHTWKDKWKSRSALIEAILEDYCFGSADKK